MKILIIFMSLSIINVVMSTIKSIVTIKGNKLTASVISGGYYAFYNIMLIYTVADFPMWEKCIVTFVCNVIGVYVVKFVEEKMRKDKLWKIEVTTNKSDTEQICGLLNDLDIPHNVIDLIKWDNINIYCATQKESALTKEILTRYDVKYFVSETKAL